MDTPVLETWERTLAAHLLNQPPTRHHCHLSADFRKYGGKSREAKGENGIVVWQYSTTAIHTPEREQSRQNEGSGAAFANGITTKRNRIPQSNPAASHTRRPAGLGPNRTIFHLHTPGENISASNPHSGDRGTHRCSTPSGRRRPIDSGLEATATESHADPESPSPAKSASNFDPYRARNFHPDEKGRGRRDGHHPAKRQDHHRGIVPITTGTAVVRPEKSSLNYKVFVAMMMMDIGMYGHGHHNQHSGTYNPSESNFFGYQSESYPQTHNSDHQLSTHYSMSYSNYEDAAYNMCGATNTSESPPPAQDLNYYSPHHQPIQDPIINTESGLSYTNLDYTNSSGCSNSGYLNSNQSIYATDVYQRTQSEVMVRHHDNMIDGRQTHPFYDTKYHPSHHLDNDSYSHLVLQNTSCAEYQHMQYKEEGISSPESDHSHRSLHTMSHLSTVSHQTPAIPTYKWMQVKRNVPKPQGKNF
ncbi:hypothetical protein RN001_006158 [Aquatica leii]|uniref:Uncharacterized protein n=1 Tax=Aquatica leii TaxID=1421715 RepID=A0AAN7SJL9_9COLE|nr:hypothetical protein RN001_006158 [Aquatica leii]